MINAEPLEPEVVAALSTLAGYGLLVRFILAIGGFELARQDRRWRRLG